MKFKTGRVYVDNVTFSAYNCNVSKKGTIYLDKIYGDGFFKITLMKNGKILGFDVNIDGSILEFNLQKINFRGWSKLDEPDTYDVKKMGEIEIGKFYKGLRESGETKSFHMVTASIKNGLHQEISSISQWEGMEMAHRIDFYPTFIKKITRPAFPYEIEKLKMPQLSGVIK